MTDTEMLDKLERYLEPKRLGCATISCKITVKYGKLGEKLIRFGGGPALHTVREAIDYMTRNVQ